MTNVSAIASEESPDANAVILGVEPGTYYVRAFIDTDGDGSKSPWESWGYSCYVGAVDAPYANISRGGDASASAADFPYTPRSYVVAVGTDPSLADIYIEDVDTDNDGLPDVWEMEQKSSLTAKSSPTGNTFFTKVNTNLVDTVKAYTQLNARGVGNSTYAAMTLMNVILSESSPEALSAAGALLSAAPESPVAEERTVVTITSFSLENGAEIAVETTVPPAASGQSVVITAPEANVDLYLSCAKTLDFADAVEVKVKSFTIRANETTTMKVGADELSAAKAKAPEAKFFKAIIR